MNFDPNAVRSPAARQEEAAQALAAVRVSYDHLSAAVQEMEAINAAVQSLDLTPEGLAREDQRVKAGALLRRSDQVVRSLPPSRYPYDLSDLVIAFHRRVVDVVNAFDEQHEAARRG